MPHYPFSACRVVASILSVCLLCAPVRTHAISGGQIHLCDAAAEIASAEIGVPVQILRAIARTESGISRDGLFSPWPWTVNVAGKGGYYDDKRAAKSHILKSMENGAENIDVGCFQINHKWHGSQFSSLDQMLDPVENARYAASFLKELYTEFGQWELAAGAYHSRNAEYSNRYLSRLIPILEDLPPAARHAFSFGRLQRDFIAPARPVAGKTRQTPGSLFPSATAARGSLFGQRDIRG